MKSRFLTQSFGPAFSILLSLFLLAPQPHGEGNAQANVPSDWRRARDAIDRLMREPSSLTTREFYISISDCKEFNSDKTEILDHIFGPNIDMFSIGKYPVIAIEMLHNDIYAARSAIKLLNFIDNGWQKPRRLTTLVGMFVGASLGDLIRMNPALFLRTCDAEGEGSHLKEKGFPVLFIPRIMNRTKTRAYYELEMRREALRSVEDAELLSIRDKCVDTIDREIEKYGTDNPGLEEHEKTRLDDPRARVKYAFAEMQSRPSPENIKRILDLFPNTHGASSVDIIDAIFPPYESYVKAPDEPFGLILHEARCGNECAVELLFRTLVHVFGLPSMQICSELSNLILSRPSLFIEKLAKYGPLLDSVNSIKEPDREIPLHYFEWTCDYISPFDYRGDCKNVILKRRLNVLAALNMPEHKELIDRCIRLLEKDLK